MLLAASRVPGEVGVLDKDSNDHALSPGVSGRTGDTGASGPTGATGASGPSGVSGAATAWACVGMHVPVLLFELGFAGQDHV